jgi:hypothetical protein
MQQIQNLPAPTLLKVVRRIGLEDSAELLALASTEQLTRMLDEDLWRNTGKQERFDAARFSRWLGVLEEMGYARAAEKLGEMDEDFLALALGHFLFVLEAEAVQFLRINVQGDSWEDDRLEKILELYHTHEFADFLVLAKSHSPWESLLPLLLALEEQDSSLLARVLQRLALAGERRSEREGGLYEVLTSEEMLEGDAEFSREQRRTRDGFVPVSDAVAFLGWIKATDREELLAMNGRDPVSRAYFRDYAGLLLKPRKERAAPAPLHPLLQELLEETQPTVPLLENSSSFSSRIAGLPGGERERWLMELNFLAQVVLQTAKGPLRAAEAADQVVRACEKGLRILGNKPGPSSPIQLFSLGLKMDQELSSCHLE